MSLTKVSKASIGALTLQIVFNRGSKCTGRSVYSLIPNQCSGWPKGVVESFPADKVASMIKNNTVEGCVQEIADQKRQQVYETLETQGYDIENLRTKTEEA